MKHRLTQTLLGFLKPVKGSPPVLSAGETSTNQHDWAGRLKVKRLKPFRMDPFGTTFRRSLRLGFLKTCRDNLQLSTVILLTCIQLLAGMGVARAATIVNNSAGVIWKDSWNQSYGIAKDTAAIFVLKPPTFEVQKDVRNLRTDETSSGIVLAIPDDIVEFSITITNTGDTVARNIVINDSMPSRTIYETGSASETTSLDPIDPPETVTFQHAAGGTFDTNDGDTITAIRWEWNAIDGIYGNNKRTVKFRLRVLK